MKKRLLLLVFIASGFSATAQLVPWQPGLQLTWDDFHSLPPEGATYSAYTAYYLSYSWKWDAEGMITCAVTCCMDENKSWRKRDRELTPGLLRHEQLHLNVAELYARKIRQAFQTYCASHKHDDGSAGELKKIFDSLMVECNSYNTRYDAESNHSMIADKQQEWDKKITKELNDMAAYVK